MPTVVADLAAPAHTQHPRGSLVGPEQGRPVPARPLPSHAETCGHAAYGRTAQRDRRQSDQRRGGNHRLGAAGHLVRPRRAHLDAPSRSEGTEQRSTMDVYDFEFAFRLDIIETARRHRADPSVELLVVPVRTSECASCPWWGHCEQLLTDVDDVSLLPFGLADVGGPPRPGRATRRTWRRWTGAPPICSTAGRPRPPVRPARRPPTTPDRRRHRRAKRARSPSWPTLASAPPATPGPDPRSPRTAGRG